MNLRIPSTVPSGVPALSSGRHAHPQEGGCFMEIAALLAGERFTDHPDCTHPLLAEVARQVNDRIGDARRQELLERIPAVIGTSEQDPRRTSALLDEVLHHRSTSRSSAAAVRARDRAREYGTASPLRRAVLRMQDRRFLRRELPDVLVPVIQDLGRRGGDRALIALVDALVNTCTTTGEQAAPEPEVVAAAAS